MWAASEAVIPVWFEKFVFVWQTTPLDSLLMHDQAVFHFEDAVSVSSVLAPLLEQVVSVSKCSHFLASSNRDPVEIYKM